MDNKKILGYIGLSLRAGRMVSGEFTVENTIKSGQAKLVIISEDASDNTKKMFKNMCTYRNVPLAYAFDRDTLGKATGKEYRVSLAITDDGLANQIIKLLKDGGKLYSE